MSIKGRVKSNILIFCALLCTTKAQNCNVGTLWNVDYHRAEDVSTEIYTVDDMVGMVNPITITPCATGSATDVNYIKITQPSDTTVTFAYQNMDDYEANQESNKNAPTICVIVKACEGDSNESSKEFNFLVLDTNNHPPEFLQDEYVFNIPMPLPKGIDLTYLIKTVIEAKDIDVTNMLLTFEIDSPDFKAEYSKPTENTLLKVHSATLTTLQSINKEGTYTLTVTDEQDPKQSDTATVIIKRNNEESVTFPNFENAIHTAKYKEGEEEVEFIEDIILNDGENAVLTLEGEFSANFEILPPTDNKITLELKTPMDVTESYTTLILIANANGIVAQTVILIEVELIDPGATTTTQRPGRTIEFNPYLPNLSLSPHQKGLIFKFEATSLVNKDVISYSLTGGPVELGLDETNGELTVLKNPIAAGEFELKITATGSVSLESTTIDVGLHISSIEVCDDDIRAKFSLLIKNVEEDTEAILLPKEAEMSDTYEFCIESQSPNEDMFYIDEVTGDVKNRKLSREASYFDGKLPQFTIKVNIQKTGGVVGKCGDSTDALIESDSILNSPITTIITVIVDDINNNPPIFDKAELVICYPNKELVKDVRPNYLAHVEATDKDAIGGNNYGLVKYYTESQLCTVDDSTGNVYPTDTIYAQSESEIKITAKDGGDPPKEAELTLKVKIIDEKHICLLTFKNVQPHELEEKLAELSAESSYDLRSFASSALPIKPEITRSGDYYLQVFIYGLSNNQPVTTQQIKEKLQNIQDLDVSSYNPSEGNGGGVIEDSDTTGLIAAIAVLAVLLVLVIAGFIGLWFFKLRHRSYKNAEDGMKFKKFKSSIGSERRSSSSSTDPTPKSSPSPSLKTPRRPTKFAFHSPPPENDETETDDQLDKVVKVDEINNVETLSPKIPDPPAMPTLKRQLSTGSNNTKVQTDKSVTFNNEIHEIKIAKTKKPGLESSDDEEDSDED